MQRPFLSNLKLGDRLTMIKYKIIQVIGNKDYIGRIDYAKFDNIIVAKKNFDLIDIYQEMLDDWRKTTKIGRLLLIAQNAFLEYDLIEYDDENDLHRVTISTKSKSFNDVNR